jgi:hypothetical protein
MQEVSGIEEELVVFAEAHAHGKHGDDLQRFIGRLNASADLLAVINNGSSGDRALFNRLEHFLKGHAAGSKESWQQFYLQLSLIKKRYIEVPGMHPHRSSRPGPTEERIGPFHCAFLNTCRNPVSMHASKYARKVLHGRNLSYDCEGITREDLDVLKKGLQGIELDSLFVFLHCPLIHSKASRIGKPYSLDTDDFVRCISRHGLGSDVMLNGGGELLAQLAGQPKNIVIVASHCTEARYYLIEKRTLVAKEVTLQEFNEEFSSSIFIKQVITPSLTSGPHRGYLVITPTRVKAIDLGEGPKIKGDLPKIKESSQTLANLVTKHRNALVQLDRIITKEREVFERIKDELQKVERIIDSKGAASIITELDSRISYSVKEYLQTYEAELGTVTRTLSYTTHEDQAYSEAIPELQAIFNDLSMQAQGGLKGRLDSLKSLFSEWYRNGVTAARALTQRIVAEEKLFDNTEKKVIKDIHKIIKDTKLSKKAKLTRLRKVKKEIDSVTHEIDSYFLHIAEKKRKLHLYSLTEEIRSSVVFLDTVLRMLRDFSEILEERS